MIQLTNTVQPFVKTLGVFPKEWLDGLKDRARVPWFYANRVRLPFAGAGKPWHWKPVPAATFWMRVDFRGPGFYQACIFQP